MSNSTQSQPFQLSIVPVTAFQQNAMIFWSTATKQGVLIDPGGEIDKLMAAIEELEVNITAIWLTHGHVDHVGAAAEARRRLKCKIHGPHKDDEWLLQELTPGTYDIPEAEAFIPDYYLEEGDTLTLEGTQFSILHCPGHSPGSVVIYQPELQFAFVGDVLFRGSIGRTDLPRGNHQQLINSITSKLWPLGEQISFVPGHGPASSFAEERQNNSFVSDKALGLDKD